MKSPRVEVICVGFCNTGVRMIAIVMALMPNTSIPATVRKNNRKCVVRKSSEHEQEPVPWRDTTIFEDIIGISIAGLVSVVSLTESIRGDHVEEF